MLPFRFDELRFSQEFSQASAVAGTTIDTTTWVCPSNTIRVILLLSLSLDISEARGAVLMVLGSSATHSIRNWNYDIAIGNPHAILEQGNSIFLLPGDRLRLDRNGATAGSTMTLRVRYIDIIMPFQKHIDPYRRFAAKSKILNPFLRRGGASGSGYGGGGESGGGGGGESGSGGEPVL